VPGHGQRGRGVRRGVAPRQGPKSDRSFVGIEHELPCDQFGPVAAGRFVDRRIGDDGALSGCSIRRPAMIRPDRVEKPGSEFASSNFDPDVTSGGRPGRVEGCKAVRVGIASDAAEPVDAPDREGSSLDRRSVERRSWSPVRPFSTASGTRHQPRPRPAGALH
jgi:hypothetical protein